MGAAFSCTVPPGSDAIVQGATRTDSFEASQLATLNAMSQPESQPESQPDRARLKRIDEEGAHGGGLGRIDVPTTGEQRANRRLDEL